MTDFATDLFWEDEKQRAAPTPVRPPGHRQDRREEATAAPAAAAPVESQAERLQRVAGNAALVREADEAVAVRRHLADAARRPETVPQAARPAKPKPAEAEKPKAEPAPARAPDGPRAGASAAMDAERRRAAEIAATAEKQRLAEATKAAAARAMALAQVLASFDGDPGKADLLGLARLCEAAPPGIAEEIARTLANAVVRADARQRTAIAARIAAELGHHRGLRLARLLADRLLWLTAPRARPAPPPPPPPPPPD